MSNEKIRLCRVPGCPDDAVFKGLCERHAEVAVEQMEDRIHGFDKRPPFPPWDVKCPHCLRKFESEQDLADHLSSPVLGLNLCPFAP